MGSPGYAWQQVSVDFSHPGEHHAELQPGAILEVRIEGELRSSATESEVPEEDEDEDDAPKLRLRTPPETPTLEQRVQDTLKEIEDSPDDVPDSAPDNA